MKKTQSLTFPARSVIWLSLTLIVWGVIDAQPLSAATDLRQALTFHASFDHGPDADFGKGDRRLFTLPTIKHPRTGTPGLPANGVVSIAKDEGRFGDALRFHGKSPEVAFYQVARNLSYAKTNWSGTVSFWLRLNPDADLEPGYCDPFQVTPRAWNDAALWVDFSKDDHPRHFRFGAFADRTLWDSDKNPEAERPQVTVTRPPFSRERWTHVLFTFTNFNTGKKNGVAVLYLDGKPEGTVGEREQTLSWDPAQSIAMLGIHYTGLFDELAFFNRALTAAEVEKLFSLPGGVSALHR